MTLQLAEQAEQILFFLCLYRAGLNQPAGTGLRCGFDRGQTHGTACRLGKQAENAIYLYRTKRHGHPAKGSWHCVLSGIGARRRVQTHGNRQTGIFAVCTICQLNSFPGCQRQNTQTGTNKTLTVGIFLSRHCSGR